MAAAGCDLRLWSQRIAGGSVAAMSASAAGPPERDSVIRTPDQQLRAFVSSTLGKLIPLDQLGRLRDDDPRLPRSERFAATALDAGRSGAQARAGGNA